MYYKTRWIQSNDFVRKTIGIRTARTGTSRIFRGREQKRFDLIKSCVYVVFQPPNKDELIRELFQSQGEGKRSEYTHSGVVQ